MSYTLSWSLCICKYRYISWQSMGVTSKNTLTERNVRNSKWRASAALNFFKNSGHFLTVIVFLPGYFRRQRIKGISLPATARKCTFFNFKACMVLTVLFFIIIILLLLPPWWLPPSDRVEVLVISTVPIIPALPGPDVPASISNISCLPRPFRTEWFFSFLNYLFTSACSLFSDAWTKV